MSSCSRVGFAIGRLRGASCGVDAVLIETMTDSYEAKAALLAAKETLGDMDISIPVIVTNAYGNDGKLMTGASPEAMAVMLEGLGADAIGLNCSTGPATMLPLVQRISSITSLPIVVNPNAGLPAVRDGKTVYDMSAEEFASCMKEIAPLAAILGGCCGTNPDYIKATVSATQDIPLPDKEGFEYTTTVSSYTHALCIGGGEPPMLIGERINPTGKPKLKEALREKRLDYIMDEGQRQVEAGVHILDVNVGLPEIDEKDMMCRVIRELQSLTDIPLQIDSSDPEVLEAAMRLYNGKPLVNSVNGSDKSMDSVFPLVKKYGGAVIALAMDESGIPTTAEGRVAIAERIIKRAEEYGIRKCDVIVDPLALTVSSDKNAALATLEAVEILHKKGIRTSLGVSNISFGLPRRDIINSVFYSDALERGLDLAIMNPFAEGMMNVYNAHLALHGYDEGCVGFIEYASAHPVSTTTNAPAPAPSGQKPASASDGIGDFTSELFKAVVGGRAKLALSCAEKMLDGGLNALDVINSDIIPALNTVGERFEKKTLYLPQLLMSADAACRAIDLLKSRMPKQDSVEGKDKKIILATVRGDIHDIGKNIVKVLLESYGFEVIDLGRDVTPEAVCEAAHLHDCRIVGLSALMTTTVPSMEDTIRMLKAELGEVFVIVGGAVLNPEYAEMIHADLYAPEAMDTVRAAQRFYGI